MRPATIRATSIAVLIASCLCLIVAMAFCAFVSLFAFDRPGSEHDPQTYLLLAVIWSPALAFLLSALASIWSIVRPGAWTLYTAIGLLVLPLVRLAILFDPLHLRH